MLGNNKVNSSQVIEIKTIDFSLINSDDKTENENSNLKQIENKVELLEKKIDNLLNKTENEEIQEEKLIQLENKLELLQKKLFESNQSIDKILDNIKNDYITEDISIKVKLEKLSSEILKNTNELKESKLIKSIIEDSITTIIKSNFKVNSEGSEELNTIKNNLLDIDLTIKNMQLQLDSLTVNFKKNVSNEISKQSEVIFDNLFNNLFNEKINDVLQNNNGNERIP